MKVTIPKNSAIVSESGYWTIQGVNDQVVLQTIKGNLNLQETIKQLERFQTSGEGNVPVPEPEIDNIAYYVGNFIDLPIGLDGDVGLVDTLNRFEVDDKNIYVKNTNWNLILGFFDQPSNFPVGNIKTGSIAISQLPFPYGAFIRNEEDEKWERFGFIGVPVVFETDAIENFYTDLDPYLSTPAVQNGDVVVVDPDSDEKRRSIFFFDKLSEKAKMRLLYTSDSEDISGYQDSTLTENNAIIILEDGVDIKNSEAYVFDSSRETFSKLGSSGILTFGSLNADYENYVDLPTNIDKGSWASHISTGMTYRLLKTGAIPIWVPVEVYAGSPQLRAYITGSETEDANLLAQGFVQVGQLVGTDPNVGIVYEGSSIVLKCSGATYTTGVSGTNAVGAYVDMAGLDNTARIWVYAETQTFDASITASGCWARWFRYRDGNSKSIQVGSVSTAVTQHWSWADTQLSGFGNQLISSSATGSVVSKPPTNRLSGEFIWDNSTTRYMLVLNHEFEGGIGAGTVQSSTGNQQLLPRVDCANNLRQNMRIWKWYAVVY